MGLGIFSSSNVCRGGLVGEDLSLGLCSFSSPKVFSLTWAHGGVFPRELEEDRLALPVAAGSGRRASQAVSSDECVDGEWRQCGVAEGVRVQFSPGAGSPSGGRSSCK